MIKNEISSHIVLGCYYFTLILFLVASLFPEGRIWGFNLLAFLPMSVKYILFGIGIIFPLFINKIFKNNLSIDENNSENIYWLVASGVVLILGLSFYFFRAQTFFLGDGYTVLSELFDDIALIKPRALGESLAHIWLSNFLGGRSPINVYNSFIIISIVSGILYLIMIAFHSRYLYESLRHRLIFFIGLSSGGFMLLWFGYVEFYSLFVFSIAIFTITGCLILNGSINRWFILPALFFSTFLHIFGVILLPAVLYILISNSYLSVYIRKFPNWIKLTFLVVSSVITGLGFYYYYITDYFFRFAFVPFTNDLFAIESYTLFSLAHLMDIVNLLILLIPGFIIFVGVMFFKPVKSIFKERESKFLLIFILSTLGAVFIFDPKIGMPRDWDLFSFTSIPITYFMFRILLRSDSNHNIDYKAIGYIIFVGFIMLFSRVAILAVPDYGIAQFKNYSRLDLVKNKNTRLVLINYYRTDNKNNQASLEYELWQKDFPYIALLDSIKTEGMESDEKKLTEAYHDLKTVIEIEPTNWNAWASLGIFYYKVKNFDSSIICLNIADGLNPYNELIYTQKANTYYLIKDYNSAEKFWLKVLDRDSTYINAIIGLSNLYKDTDNRVLFDKYFYKIDKHPEAPDEYLYLFYKMYLKTKDFQQAERIYEILKKRGYDSTNLEDLSNKI